MKHARKLILMLLLSSVVCGCSDKRPTDDKDDKDSGVITNRDTLADTEVDLYKEHDSVDESFGAVDTSDVKEDDEDNTSADFEDSSKESREHAGSGELRVPKKSKSKTPPKNPTEDDIGIEGDDTWYIKVNWTVYPNFEKHKGENIEFKVDNMKLSFGRTVDELYEYATKKGWECINNYASLKDYLMEPGEEASLGFADENGHLAVSVNAFQPHTKKSCKGDSLVIYRYNVNVNYLEDFDFLNMGTDTNVYDLQYLQKAKQFPIVIDEANIYTEVETGLGKVGFYDDGSEYNPLSGFYYELSKEEKDKLIIED